MSAWDLMRFRRINRDTERNIMTSPVLRKILYLEPSDSHPKGINRFLPKFFRTFICWNQSDRSWHDPEYGEIDFAVAKRAFGTGALWEQMLFLQPLVTSVSLTVGRSWNPYGSASPLMLRSESGVTAGQIMEGAQSLAVAASQPSWSAVGPWDEAKVVRFCYAAEELQGRSGMGWGVLSPRRRTC
ncbi:hypothetical protein LTR85_003848 [Meristemomyces frigidus]|nr:hypothetical protein LTR85_003848 [Meristemomyces frigidus]